MIDHIKEAVAELHNKHISEFRKQIHHWFHGTLDAAGGHNRLPDDEPAFNSVIDRDAGHDKVTGFRNNLGTMPNPNQPELARLVNDRTGGFEREIKKIPSLTDIEIRSELQTFKEELMAAIYSGVQQSRLR